MYRKILSSNPVLKDANIVIVDDSDVSREIIQNIYTGLGFNNIFLMKDGAEALDNIRSINPDIIITDIYMPEMDGHALMRKVRGMEGFNFIPIIVQTGSTDSAEIKKAFESGASDVIYKPVRKDEILSRTTFHLENSVFRKRIQKELDAAKSLQLSMLPDQDELDALKEKYNIDIASVFLPCSEIGGDFWGVRKISHSELGIYTVDISGHGISAALNTFRIHGILDDSNNFFSSSSIFLKKLNKRMADLMPVGQFSTMFYGVININEDHLQYSSAASPGGMILRKNGKIDMLNGTGFPLGVNIDAEYDTHESPYKQGDSIIIYSDALIETPNENGDFLTDEEISRVLHACTETTATEMVEKLLKKFRTHIGDRPFADDLTINIYKRL